EGGTLTGAAGADKAVGTVMLETAAPLKDAYSARVPNVASSYLQKLMTPTSDLYVSLYVRLHALPAAAARVVQISNAGTTVGNIMVSTSGRLQLRVGSATIGESAALAVGQVYRIGIRQKQGSGGNAVLEGYAASADGVFAGAFAATSLGAWTTASDQLRVGATSPSAIDVVMDDIRLDAASMPDGLR
ncbi:MAG TPA: hypothetical protein VK911_16270, partial [Vicinamibacterales bacterium]|nr:hypothetical protein [Vicinamibacterales bacterium]